MPHSTSVTRQTEPYRRGYRSVSYRRTARKPHWCMNDFAHDRHIYPGHIYLESVIFPGHDSGYAGYGRYGRPVRFIECRQCAEAWGGQL